MEADDDFLLKMAIEASLNNVPPMTGPDACTWSRSYREREEAERVRHLQEKAERQATRVARRVRAYQGVPLILLDDDEEVEGRSGLRRNSGVAATLARASPRRQETTTTNAPWCST